MKLTINNQEVELTEEEFEEIASQLLNGSLYISNISYDFGNDKPFTEEMTIVGNLEFIKQDWNYDESS